MKKYCTAIVAVMLAVQSAWGHAPYLSCTKSDEVIHCKGGFSDGSSAYGVRVKVLSYDEEVLFEGRLDKKAEISFPFPEGEFYIKFDGGAGHEAEIDYTDIIDSQYATPE